MAKKPSKPAAKRGKAKIAALAKKAKARTKKPSKTARKKAANAMSGQAERIAAVTAAKLAASLQSAVNYGAAADRGVERAQAQKPRWWARFKSAVNGLFVSRKQAEADPDGTFGTRLRRRG